MMKAIGTGKDNKPVSGAVAGTFGVINAGVSGTDYAPFLNPKSNLSKVALHSALDYIGRVTTITANATFAAGSYPSDANLTTVDLGAHGQSGKPMIIAELSLDNSTWFVMNGTTYSAIGQALRGRSFHIQVDATKIYVVCNQVGTLSAQTLYFRIHILDRTFGAARPDNGIAFRADTTHIEAAGGVFNTNREYLQTPSPGQSPVMTLASGPTIITAVGDESGELDVGFGSAGNNFNIPLSDAWATSWPPYITQGNKTSLVFAGTGTLAARARMETGRIRLANASGGVVYDSARKMVSFVTEAQTTITIPARAAVASDTPHEVVHYALPVPSGTSIVLGWLEFKTSSMRIAINKPLEFSGSLIVFGWWYVSGGLLYMRGLSIIYPRIKSGNLEIVEHYYNRTMAGSGNPALPTYSADVHLFACATTGGL